MRVSTKGRFAVDAMIDLTLRSRHGPVALAGIAQRQQVSLSYLEQMFSRLRQAGIVNSTRGPGGGYTLARDAEQISVADIVSAVETGETGERDAADAGGGRLHTAALWDEVREVMLRHLGTVSLRALAETQRDTVPPGESAARPARLLPRPSPQRTPRTTAPNSVFAFGQSFSGR